MFLLENSLIGAKWNKVYDSGERHGLFSCYWVIKANSVSKELNITNINTKGIISNRQIAQLLNSFMFNCQNHHHLGAAVIFDSASAPTTPPTLTLFKSMNDSLSHHSFFVSILSPD